MLVLSTQCCATGCPKLGKMCSANHFANLIWLGLDMHCFAFAILGSSWCPFQRIWWWAMVAWNIWNWDHPITRSCKSFVAREHPRKIAPWVTARLWLPWRRKGMQLGKSKSTHKVAKRVLRTWACPTQKGRNHEKKSQSCSPWAWSGPHWCEWQHCPNLVPSQQSQQIWSPSLAAPFPFGATLPMPYWWLQWQTRRWERSAHWSNRRQEVLCLEQAVCKYQSYMCLAAMQGQDDWPAPPMGHPLARWGAWYGIDVQLSFEARSNSYTHSLYPWPGWGCHVTWWMACLTALWAIGKSSLLLPCSSNTVCNVNLCRFKCQGKTVMNECWDSLAAIWCSAKKLYWLFEWLFSCSSRYSPLFSIQCLQVFFCLALSAGGPHLCQSWTYVVCVAAGWLRLCCLSSQPEPTQVPAAFSHSCLFSCMLWHSWQAYLTNMDQEARLCDKGCSMQKSFSFSVWAGGLDQSAQGPFL